MDPVSVDEGLAAGTASVDVGDDGLGLGLVELVREL